MNKYEQLIEYVINDEDTKAQSLFHEIVVEKSRGIYEGLMDQDEMGGDEVDQLINDVESEERGFSEDDDEMAMEPEIGGDMEGGMSDMEGGMSDMDAEEGDIEDRVVDLEDKLDELMAEFDSIIGSDEEMGGEEPGMSDMDDMGGEEPGMSDMDDMGGEEEMDMESRTFESEEEDLDEGEEALEEEIAAELDEAVSLTKVTKGIAGTTEGESVGSGSETVGVNKKTINNDNSGKKLTGGAAKSVDFTSADETGAGNISVKDEGYTTEPRQSKVSKGIANKSEEGSVNKKSLAKARK